MMRIIVIAVVKTATLNHPFFVSCERIVPDHLQPHWIYCDLAFGSVRRKGVEILPHLLYPSVTNLHEFARIIASNLYCLHYRGLTLLSC